MATPYTYMAILRCQTWHIWPEKSVIEASSFTLDLGLSTPIPAQLAVVTYLQRSEPTMYAKEKTEIGPLIWTGAIQGNYTVRDTVLKAPKDITEITCEHEHARRGEVDISIAFRYNGDLTEAALEAIRCTLFATMSLLNLELSDFLTPVAPMQIRKVVGDKFEFASTVVVAVRDRRQLNTDPIEANINNISRALSTSANAGKLRTALELYGSHFFERQARTRFLLLVIALETLAIPMPKHPVALHLLEKWKAELIVELSRHPEASAEYVSLEALSRELLQRREDSIRSQVRMLFKRAAKVKGDDPAPFERRALNVYDIRSSLVHDGSLAPGVLDKAESDARELLEYVFSTYASGPQQGP